MSDDRGASPGKKKGRRNPVPPPDHFGETADDPPSALLSY
jgi:hypothetical protein